MVFYSLVPRPFGGRGEKTGGEGPPSLVPETPSPGPLLPQEGLGTRLGVLQKSSLTERFLVLYTATRHDSSSNGQPFNRSNRLTIIGWACGGVERSTELRVLKIYCPYPYPDPDDFVARTYRSSSVYNRIVCMCECIRWYAW